MNASSEQLVQRDTSHPVWPVYDLYRTARFNIKCYSCRLEMLQRINFIIDLVIAITTPSSAVASYVSKDWLGWRILLVVAAVFAAAKPFLGFKEKMQRYAEIISGYRYLENDLEAIIYQIRLDRKLSNKSIERFNNAHQMKGKLDSKLPPGEVLSKSLLNRCFEETQNELPAEQFYIPEEN